jgi:competence CoiA-like predicted nuclease
METSKFINSVEESETYMVYEALKNAGFKVQLMSYFSHAYNRDNNYLAIEVKEANDRLPELWSLRGNMKIVVSKYVSDDMPYFELRKNQNCAELVSDEVWRKYVDKVYKKYDWAEINVNVNGEKIQGIKELIYDSGVYENRVQNYESYAVFLAQNASTLETTIDVFVRAINSNADLRNKPTDYLSDIPRVVSEFTENPELASLIQEYIENEIIKRLRPSK